MEENAPQQARPGVRTGIPLKLSAETVAVPQLHIEVGIGHVYKDKSDGSLWTLTGLRSGRSVILTSNADGREYRDRVPVDTTLPDDYEYVGCDHENHCCTSHRTHVMPHRGCMMR
ncbi:hypothetical protein [Arthrobacter sp. UYCo732]|uniref:hypothetical protein n=1 Tax=Arthrobacter sp. UYCo732 TaxID=3156336 RepID=UPI00339B3CF5